jgi:cell division protein ZapB
LHPQTRQVCRARYFQPVFKRQLLRHSSESIHWNPMEDTDLQALMARLELLIKRVEQLKSQNGLLLAQEKSWREERAHLIEKNEIARHKVESMISRLKALEQDS